MITIRITRIPFRRTPCCLETCHEKDLPADPDGGVADGCRPGATVGYLNRAIFGPCLAADAAQWRQVRQVVAFANIKLD